MMNRTINLRYLPGALLVGVVVLSALLLPSASAQQNAAQGAGVYAIRNARIVTVTGAVIERGTVLIRDGKIAEVGANVAVPGHAKVIEARGLSVYPGLIDSGTTLGLTEVGAVQETRDTTELGDFNPQIRALVAVNPGSELIPVARANGVTTVLTSPTGRLVSGQAALINLDGWTWKEMALKASAAMAMQWPAAAAGRFAAFLPPDAVQNFAQQRERQLTALRQKLDDAKAYAQAKEARAKDPSLPARPTDFVLEALIPVIKGELPVVISASSERDIRGAVELADKYKLKIIIRDADDAWKVAALLKEKNVPVIIGPVTEVPNREDADYDQYFAHAAKLHQAGVRFAFQTSDAAYVRNLPYQAGTAAAFGLPKDEALKAVTIYPAQIFGVDKLIGSIEPGKLANLIVTDGDPLEFKTNVRQMFINGRPVDLSSRHSKLYDKYASRP